MTITDKDLPAPKKFCSSFWTEAVLSMSGDLNFCCRNPTSLGNWAKDGLHAAWNSETARTYRRRAAEGYFPDHHCKACYEVGGAYEVGRPLGTQLARFVGIARRVSGEGLPEIGSIISLFDKKEIDAAATNVLAGSADELQRLASLEVMKTDPEFALAVGKLKTIRQVIRSFLIGEESPPVLAPAREINLINYCNARCIHCPGLFVGESPDGHLKDGIEITPGVFLKAVDEAMLPAAFAQQHDILDFWCNGTEFLLYREWEKIYDVLVKNSIMTSTSTNSIALTERATHTLIDGGSLAHMNISIDGATRETIEKVRVNVRYDKLVKNVRYFLKYAIEKNSSVVVNFTFVIMKSNYLEIPDFIDFVLSLYNGAKPLHGTILFTCLIPGENPRYIEMMQREHHSLVPDEELRALLAEAARRCALHGMAANVTYAHEINAFLSEHMPFPSMEAA